MSPQTSVALVWFLAVYIEPAVMALGLTLLVELAVALALGWRTGTNLRDLSLGPLVLFMVVLEVVIVLVEWRLLRWALKKDWRKTALLSAAMNGASFAAGLVVLVGL